MRAAQPAPWKDTEFDGEVAKAYREKAGLNQTELGLAVGVSASTVSRIEAGKVSPSYHDIEVLTAVLAKRLGKPGLHLGRKEPAGSPPELSCDTPQAIIAATYEVDGSYWLLGNELMNLRVHRLLAQSNAFPMGRELDRAKALLHKLCAATCYDRLEALGHYENAIRFARRCGDRELLQDIYGRGALVMAQSEEQECRAAALPWAEKAEKDFRELGYTAARLCARFALAQYFAYRNEKESAKNWVKAGKDIFPRVPPAGLIVSDGDMPEWRMHLTIVRVYSSWGDPDAEASVEIARAALPVDAGRAATQLDMLHGLILIRRGDRRRGLDRAGEALWRLPVAKRSATLHVVSEQINRAAGRRTIDMW
jgi:transcriptional regulator with XRE-family HTH domain